MVKNVEENRQIVQTALENKEIDVAINIRWPFITEFLKFIKVKGIFNELEKIVGENKRTMIKSHIFALIYIIKIIVGIPRIRGTEKLLGDLGAMSLLGFDVDTLENGLCKRGDANQHGKDFKKNWHYGSVYGN